MRKVVCAVIAIALLMLVPSAMLLAQEKATPEKGMQAQEKVLKEKATCAKEVKESKLTDEQKAKLEQFCMDQRMKAIDLRAEIEKLSITLKKELMKESPAKTEIEATLRKMADARVKLQMLRIEGMLNMRTMLGPDWKMLMKECCPGAEWGELCEMGGMEMETAGAMGMGPMAGCMGSDEPMGEGRKMIMIRKGAGGCMGMGGAGGGCMMGMGGCMMEKGGAGCSMKAGGMGGSCMMHGGGCCCSEKSGMKGACTMGKAGAGCCMGPMMSGCMKMRGMGCAGTMHTQCKGTCSRGSGGWRYKHLYRPHFSSGSCQMMGGMKGCCAGEMKSGCVKEKGCSMRGSHKCTADCRHEVKVEVETKQ